MAGERKQKKRLQETPRKPKEPEKPEKPVIGSSSTWKEEELEKFRVARGDAVMDAKGGLIPEKWFDFGGLEKYQSARNQLVSVQPDDFVNNDDVLFDKSRRFYAVFTTLQRLQGTKITNARKENLAEKRHEKRSQSILSSQVAQTWVGLPASPQSEDEQRRVASISNPAQSSAGSQLFYACQEKDSEHLADLFCSLTFKELFRKNPPIPWVTNRDPLPVLQWSGIALAAEVKLGPALIGARTDGGLQICLPQGENFVTWDRSYYEIALEAKRFFKSKRNKDGSEDISEVANDSINAREIFAEMLGAVCHPEFFDHTDAYGIYIQHTSFQLYHCLFPQQYLHELYHNGEPATDGVTLNRSKAYDFCKVDERGEWFDVFVALIQYLLSGESKVGFLNNSHPRNLIHKSLEPEQADMEAVEPSNITPDNMEAGEERSNDFGNEIANDMVNDMARGFDIAGSFTDRKRAREKSPSPAPVADGLDGLDELRRIRDRGEMGKSCRSTIGGRVWK